MSGAPVQVGFQAMRFRQEFDALFQEPLVEGLRESEKLLLCGLPLGLYGLRIQDLLGLAPGLVITALPSRSQDLLGLAGFRGRLVPVYSLARFLGQEDSGAASRWVALSGDPDPLGLSFPILEGYVRLDKKEGSFREAEGNGEGFVERVVELGTKACTILRVRAILENIKARAGQPAAAKEG